VAFDSGGRLADEEAGCLAEEDEGYGSAMEVDGDGGFCWLPGRAPEGPGEGWTFAV